MTSQDVVRIVGEPNNVTTMGDALGQLKGFVVVGDGSSGMMESQLWTYEL
jgi:hypothetical protein